MKLPYCFIAFTIFSHPVFATMLSDDSDYKQGVKYLKGNGVDVNNFKALDYFKNSGNGLSLFEMGLMYENADEDLTNYTVAPDNELAKKLFAQAFAALQTSSDAGDPSAQLYLAVMYYNGLGTKTDFKKARQLIDASTQKGYPESWSMLAGLVLKSDPDLAYKYYEKAIELGFPEAQKGLVSVLEYKMKNGNYDNKYRVEINKLADKGNGYAMLSQAYDLSNNATPDYSKAMKLFNDAAKIPYGDLQASAFSGISLMYNRGEGVIKNRQTALHYLDKACQKSIFECYNRDVFKRGEETWPE
ncbi:tetratricopeptide repeat protein [Buttiauxella selenatireducens]|uniref:Tetratricopeptide repeat protein n=1 Tax=Buttiauxella selenatireducens TaxID=3073902 RepID=A0ABY9S816_9ENTR|nr:tetratricopeptide repeat protein [Buttiauxella sp. R73]WMY72576.1 tetratricopeptide repeat protein [Buttiauxella sp. R73]